MDKKQSRVPRVKQSPTGNKSRTVTTPSLKERRRHAIIALSVLFVLLVVFDLSPFGGGNIRFYGKWIECGTKPVGLDYNIGGGWADPQLIDPPVIDFMRNSFTTVYSCSPESSQIKR